MSQKISVTHSNNICRNDLNESPRFFDDNSLCFSTRMCTHGMLPFCEESVERCRNQTKTLSSTNQNFKTLYEKYRTNVNTLDILERMKRGLTSTIHQQTNYVDYLDLHKSDIQEYVKNTQKQSQKIGNLTEPHTSLITQTSSSLTIHNVTFMLNNERGKNFGQYAPAFINADGVLVDQIKTIFNLKNKDETFHDAATALFQHLIPPNINEEKNSGGDEQNKVYQKCFEVESSSAFLTNLVITVKNEIRNYQLKKMW